MIPAAVLLSAALGKVLDLRGLRHALTQLGIRPKSAAAAVIGAEMITAVALVVVPGAWWPRVLVVLLATGFAGAGLMAVLTKKRVSCRCFGSTGRARLG